MEKAFNIIPTRLIKEGFLLPPGEGQEEGVGIKKKCLLNRSPLPNPLPVGEGV